MKVYRLVREASTHNNHKNKLVLLLYMSVREDKSYDLSGVLDIALYHLNTLVKVTVLKFLLYIQVLGKQLTHYQFHVTSDTISVPACVLVIYVSHAAGTAQ